MNKKTIYIIEAILMVICCFIGVFEDAFVGGAFVIAAIYNLIVCLFYKKWTGDRFYIFIRNMLFEWAVFLFSVIFLYGLYIMIFGYADYGFFGDREVIYYYGLDAICNNLFLIIAGIPLLILCGIYILIIYLTVIRNRKK